MTTPLFVVIDRARYSVQPSVVFQRGGQGTWCYHDNDVLCAMMRTHDIYIYIYSRSLHKGKELYGPLGSPRCDHFYQEEPVNRNWIWVAIKFGLDPPDIAAPVVELLHDQKIYSSR